MKKTGFTLLALSLMLGAASCVSPGRAAVLADFQPIALVSVVSNWDINWHGEEAVNPGFISAGARRSLHENPDLAIVLNAEELINTAENLVRGIMPLSGLIIFAEPESVFLSAAYSEAPLNRRRMNHPYVVPQAYRLIDPRNRNFPAALAEETGIQRSMFVEFNFTKAMRSGIGRSGQAGANVDMRVLIVDAGGRTLFSRTFTALSRGTIGVSSGMYSRSGLIALLEAAISDACYNFLDHLEDRLFASRW